MQLNPTQWFSKQLCNWTSSLQSVYLWYSYDSIEKVHIGWYCHDGKRKVLYGCWANSVSWSRQIDKLSNYFYNWLLKLNTTKTICRVFHLTNHLADYELSITTMGKRIPFDETPKYLAVTLNCTLYYRGLKYCWIHSVCPEFSIIKEITYHFFFSSATGKVFWRDTLKVLEQHLHECPISLSMIFLSLLCV